MHAMRRSRGRPIPNLAVLAVVVLVVAVVALNGEAGSGNQGLGIIYLPLPYFKGLWHPRVDSSTSRWWFEAFVIFIPIEMI